MDKKRNSSKIEKLIEEATTDCYNEHEAFSGWATTLENSLKLPCKCLLLGEEAMLTGIDTDESGTSVLGIIKKGNKKIRIPAQDIELKDKAARGAIWLDAYRHWLGT